MEIKVLDKGFVKLVDYMGCDLAICQAARVSTGAEADKGPTKNEGLINYLYKNDHLTPFEQVTIKFHIKCPLFVARQWMRHRTMSFNEASGRYKEFKWECHEPSEWRIQDTKNKQNSLDNSDLELQERFSEVTHNSLSNSKWAYQNNLHHGAAREQARIVMPLAQYTEFFMTVNLRNLFHFLELRMHEHAQKEIREYAYAISIILQQMNNLKFSVKVFDKMRELKYLYNKAASLDEKALSMLLIDFIDERE